MTVSDSDNEAIVINSIKRVGSLKTSMEGGVMSIDVVNGSGDKETIRVDTDKIPGQVPEGGVPFPKG